MEKSHALFENRLRHHHLGRASNLWHHQNIPLRTPTQILRIVFPGKHFRGFAQKRFAQVLTVTSSICAVSGSSRGDLDFRSSNRSLYRSCTTQHNAKVSRVSTTALSCWVVTQLALLFLSDIALRPDRLFS